MGGELNGVGERQNTEVTSGTPKRGLLSGRDSLGKPLRPLRFLSMQNEVCVPVLKEVYLEVGCVPPSPVPVHEFAFGSKRQDSLWPSALLRMKVETTGSF